MIKNGIYFFIIFLNITFFLFFQKKDINKTKIIIEPGMQLNQISNILMDNEIIKNKFIFKFWVKINNSETELKFGEYLFHEEISYNSILKKLKDGKSLSRKITIVEGTTKNQLLKILNNFNRTPILNYEDIPNQIIADTYFYQVSDDPRDILESITKKSREISEKLWEDRDQTIPLKNINELFILASIVEKETFLQEEKSIISGVFYNRFKKNMKLQSDPTVVYAITLGKKKMNRKLLRKDLKFDSKFNTYVNRGLPPEPICIPGIDSLEAASKPYKSNYLYFVSKNKKDEGHLFSVKYKEHLENIKSVRKQSKDE